MPQVTGLICPIITGKMSGAGTDGRIYLGIGGREFRLDSSADDYERGNWREYILGTGSGVSPLPQGFIQVIKKEWNDPREGLIFDVSAVARLPKYLRFEAKNSDDNWNIQYAAVLVYSPEFAIAYTVPDDFQSLWLGDSSGKTLHFTQEFREDRGIFDDIGRRATELGVKR